jgi:hypothetical protein
MDHVTQEELAACRQDPRKAKTVRSPDWITCLECGRLLKKLSAHHLRSHGIVAERYKEKWGYNRGTRLCSKSISKERATIAREMKLGRRGRNNLKPFRRGHGGYQRRREGTLNVVELHAGNAKPRNRKLVDGHAVSDFEIAEARLRGDILDSIAARTGLSTTAILFRLRRLGFPANRARRPAFQHGAPVTGQAIADLLEASNVSALGLTKLIGLTPSALYPHLRRPRKTIPFDLARAIQVQGHSRARPAATPKGGRPAVLLPADMRALPEKYRALHADLKLLRQWISERNGRLKDSEVRDWICDQARLGRIRTLLFWPAFFRWVRKVFPAKSFFGDWRPQEVAFAFLADDYGASERTLKRVIFQTGSRGPDRTA